MSKMLFPASHVRIEPILGDTKEGVARGRVKILVIRGRGTNEKGGCIFDDEKLQYRHDPSQGSYHSRLASPTHIGLGSKSLEAARVAFRRAGIPTHMPLVFYWYAWAIGRVVGCDGNQLHRAPANL